jgi:transcriptional regulator with XRE-family HTH domain
MSFGRHLRGLREAAGLSRPQLSRRAGVPVGTLRNWEADRGFPGLPAALRLAEALGVPVERFAEGVEDPAEDDPAPRRPYRPTNLLQPGLVVFPLGPEYPAQVVQPMALRGRRPRGR